MKNLNTTIDEEIFKSDECRNLITWIIEGIKKYPDHEKKITDLLNVRNKKMDVEGIIHLLVSSRGNLHHFTNKSAQKQGTPFNHEEFQSIAWVAMGLATYAIAQKILEINTKN